MDLIIDVLIQVIFETFAEGFVALSAFFVPNKTLSPKTEKTLRIIFAFIGMLMLILLVVGIILLVESQGRSIPGLIFVISSGIYVLTSIIFRIFFAIKNKQHGKKMSK